MSFVAQASESSQEFERVLGFFQEHLRSDTHCALEDEYPLVFRKEHSALLRIDPKTEEYLEGRLRGEFDSNKPAQIFYVEESGVLKAGLAVLVRELEVNPGRWAKLAFVGSVITAPQYREHGLQRDLFEVLENAAQLAGIDLICLWSNQLKFYQKLGYELGGLQATWMLRPSTQLSKDSIQVKFGSTHEIPFQEDFYASFQKKSHCVKRSLEEMEELWKIPQMKVACTEQAYALMGKGEDFQGICHEWAGPAPEVLACMDELKRQAGQLMVLMPGVVHSEEEQSVCQAFEVLGLENSLEYLGLFKSLSDQLDVKNLDPEKLYHPFFIWGLDSI